MEQKKELYQCKECGFYYREQELADKCEEFCRKNNSCSLAITKHAVRGE